MLEILAAVAVTVFAATVVYTFYMLAEEVENERKTDD